MSPVLLVTLVVVAWCLLPLPLAVAVGRAFRAGEVEQPVEDDVRVG
jgi:hypothetical protein